MNKLKALLPMVSMLVLCGCARTPGEEGGVAPDVSFTSLESGNSVKLSSFHGKTVVLDFWATWCEPCMEAMPKLAELNKEYASKNVQFIGVSMEDKPVVQHTIDRVMPGYPIFLDTDQSANTKFAVEALPTVVIIDPDGKIAYKDEGPMIEIVKAEIEKAIRK